MVQPHEAHEKSSPFDVLKCAFHVEISAICYFCDETINSCVFIASVIIIIRLLLF